MAKAPMARIQIVEDETMVAAGIEEALSSLNYEVTGIASTGKEALQLARQKRPNLILMDIHLEGEMDGIQIAELIKSEFDIPIVFLTAYVDGPTFSRANNLEPYGYILKPFRQMELSTVVKLAIHRHQREELRKQESKQTLVTKPDEKPKIPSPDFISEVHLPHPPTFGMVEATVAKLSALPPFNGLSADLLRKISEVCFVSSFRSFDVLIHEGREQRFGFLVMEGRVALFKRSPGGKELILDLIGKADLFPLVALLDGSTCPYSARSQGKSQILWIPREVMEYLARYFPEINKAIVNLVLERLRRAQDFTRALAHDKVEVRVADGLLAIATRFGSKVESGIEIALTRQELAELVGTAPETISRVFANFVSAGALDISTLGKVRILSEDYLRDIARV